MSHPFNKMILVLATLSFGALLSQCGGLTHTVQAAPAGEFKAAEKQSSEEIEGLQVENDGDTVRYTVVDTERSFLILGAPIGPDQPYEQVENGQTPIVQVALVGQTIKVRADRVSRAYELVPRIDCPAGPCLPCIFNNCTEPMPPPRGPDEPDWLEGFWLNDRMERPGLRPGDPNGVMNDDDWTGLDGAPGHS